MCKGQQWSEGSGPSQEVFSSVAAMKPLEVASDCYWPQNGTSSQSQMQTQSQGDLVAGQTR